MVLVLALGVRACRTHTQDATEVVAHWLLELLVSARFRVPVGPPAPELRGVPEPAPLHVVVGDLDHQVGTQRRERQVLARAPPALGPRHTVGVRDSRWAARSLARSSLVSV